MQRQLAVDVDLQRLLVHRKADVVPLAVADVYTGADFALKRTGQVGAEVPRARVGVDLPVLAGSLGVGRDKDIEAPLGKELRPAFDRERRLAVAVVSLDADWHDAGIEGLAELAVREREPFLDWLFNGLLGLEIAARGPGAAAANEGRGPIPAN